MTENAHERLSHILALLGPGLWLHIDGTNMRAEFGRENQVTAAKDFAARNGATFIPIESSDPDGIVGKFGRAYSK
jgi:hypothetical protein